jgi:hypothetical protein
MRTSPRILFCLLVFSVLAAGCVTPPQDHYYWGNYEALLLVMYAEPGSADPVMQIEKLSVDIQQAESVGKPVPPGLYAHLGFMYAMNGDVSQAESAFYEERKLFPESAVFIDGMMERALQNGEISIAPAE